MRRLLLVVGLVAAACRSGAGTRCERVCRAEADCAEKLDVPDVDLARCIEACGELERDPRTQAAVEDHIRCVTRAATCSELLECP